MRYYYWDMTNIPLNEKKTEEFKKYIKENKHKFLLIDSNLYVDTDALAKRFCCEESVCDIRVEYEGENIHDIFNNPARLKSMCGSCCDGGCIISKDFVSLTNSHYDALLSYLPSDSKVYVNTFGFYESFVVGNKVYLKTNVKRDNSCIFSCLVDGKKECALSLLSRDKGLNIFEIKPFDCCLFPLDIIVDDGIYYMTAVSEEHSFYRFSETDKPIHLTCIKQNAYGTPLYKYCRELIIDIFGDLVYDIINAYYIEKEREG